MSTCGEPAAMNRRKRMDCRSLYVARHSGWEYGEQLYYCRHFGGALVHPDNKQQLGDCCLELLLRQSVRYDCLFIF